MTSVTDVDGEMTVYTYDAAGRRIKTSTPTLTTEYAYDAIGNLTKQQTTGKTELSVEYVYDLNNGITEETRTENGSSVKSKYTYDKLGQLTAWSNSDGHSESYAYDAVGNMTSKVTNGTKISMTYDAANELKTMESVNGRIDYSYDRNGNLTQKTLGSRADTYSYDVYDQLVSYKGYDGYCQRYTYNAQGHTVKKETQGNGDRQTLEEIVRGDEKKEAASEGDDDDPDPYANSATSGTWQVTTYVYDITAPYYEVLTETTNGQTTAYTYGTERIAAYTGNSKTQYVYDGRGSVALEIGNEILSKSYTPFGEQLNTKVSGYGYNGEYYDSATGMLDLRARQYEPAQMRFSQKDILKGNKAIPLTQNLYAYCINAPVNLIDPSGHKMVSVDTINVGGGSAAIEENKHSAQSIFENAQKQLETELLSKSVQTNDLTEQQAKVISKASKELKKKAANGTLTKEDADRIIATACREVTRVNGSGKGNNNSNISIEQLLLFAACPWLLLTGCANLVTTTNNNVENDIPPVYVFELMEPEPSSPLPKRPLKPDEYTKELIVQIAKDSGANEHQLKIITRAAEQYGTPYPKLDNNGRIIREEDGSALDCSQLAQIAYGDDIKEALHQTCYYQLKYLSNEEDNKKSNWTNRGIDTSMAQPGDAIYFATTTNRRSVFHVAIYIGDGKMIESTLTDEYSGVIVRPIDTLVYDHGEPGHVFGIFSPPGADN